MTRFSQKNPIQQMTKRRRKIRKRKATTKRKEKTSLNMLKKTESK